VGFDSDLNGATFLTATTALDLPEMTKRKLADRILDEVVGLRRPQSLLVELSGMEPESALEESEIAIASRRQIMIE
jgi:phosphopantothenoylcysteine decarboxylase/phosphopantothenate--cysteine ligase